MKIIENTNKKIIKEIENLKSKGIIYFGQEKHFTLNTVLQLLCPTHGEFTLTGRELRQHKSCPECETKIIDNHYKMFNYLDTQQKKLQYLFNVMSQNKKQNKLKPLTYVSDLDEIIYCECPEHGHVITTPRKLFGGNYCKWCDGIDDNEYKLNKKFFIAEKLHIKFHQKLDYTTNVNKEFYKVYENGGLKWIHKSVLKTPNEQYTKYLKTNNNIECWNSMFFKIGIVDNGTKMRFTLVGRVDFTKEQHQLLIKNIKEKDFTPEEFHEFGEGILSKWLDNNFKNVTYEPVYVRFTTPIRSWFLMEQYKEENQQKEINLPTELINKITKTTKSIETINKLGLKFYWSEYVWESTNRSIAYFRDIQLEKDNICPICRKTVVQPVVDHQHKKKVKGTGYVRNNICNTCNTFIAKMENNCKRHNISNENMPRILNYMAEFFTEQQFRIIHYTDKEKRQQLKKTEINKILKFWELWFPGKKVPTIPKSLYITKDWVEPYKKLQEHLENPPKKYMKSEWNNHNKLFNEKFGRDMSPYPEKYKIITPIIQRELDLLKD